VWHGRLGCTRTLDSHACRLRRKLTVDGERFVETSGRAPRSCASWRTTALVVDEAARLHRYPTAPAALHAALAVAEYSRAGMEDAEHLRVQDRAIRLEGDGYRRLLAGDAKGARSLLREAAAAYRGSWEVAPPRSFGRLVGMLKAAVIAGGGADEASYVRAQVGPEGDSPASWYALGVVALVEGDDGLARRAAAGMRQGSAAFGRAADALQALADGDRERYARAVGAIVADFERREDHLTGVRIADTALMFEVLAQPRGLSALPQSDLLPSP
jgi:hypothetical protein